VLCVNWCGNARRSSSDGDRIVANQTEKAFQKQEAVFVGRVSAGKKQKKGLRFVRNVGLGFKTPKEAIEVCCHTSLSQGVLCAQLCRRRASHSAVPARRGTLSPVVVRTRRGGMTQPWPQSLPPTGSCLLFQWCGVVAI
jgi:hypothetical protein